MSTAPTQDMKRALSALGGPLVLGDAVYTREGFIELEDCGIPQQAFDYLFRSFYPSSDRDAAMRQAVGFDVSSIEGQRLSPAQTGATLAFAALYDLATTILGSKSEAAAWFSRSESALDGRTPLAVMKDHGGSERLEQLLGRLAYNVYT